MKYLIVILIAFTLNSCLVMQNGSTSSGPLLSIADKKVDKAFGKARTVFVFGIGRHKRDFLVDEAQTNLYDNRPVKSNEYYSNFTCNVAHKLFLFGFIFITKTTVTADVLKSATAPEPRPLPFIGVNYFINESDSFNVGDDIFYGVNDGQINKYKISSVSISSVKLKSDNNAAEIDAKTSDVFYTNKKTIRGFKAGDEVKVATFLFAEHVKIAAVNNKGIIFDMEGQYIFKPFAKVKK